jgi:TrmH family RNA methyltransferase
MSPKKLFLINVLGKPQERILRELQTKKGREERGMFIIEGEKFVKDAGDLVEFTFGPKDTNQFREYVSTETPQTVAAVARIPKWTREDLQKYPTIVVLDGVQDPGNVGTILRACLGFRASLILIESADPTNPKTVRSSASAILRVPWVTVPRGEAEEYIVSLARPIYRLELTHHTILPKDIASGDVVLIAGSEGQGIRLDIEGTSVKIPQQRALESLNVAMAVGMVLYEREREYV